MPLAQGPLRGSHFTTIPPRAAMGFLSPLNSKIKLLERDYLKGRLAAAFRIFGQKGFEEGVVGHITVRVSELHCVPFELPLFGNFDG